MIKIAILGTLLLVVVGCIPPYKWSVIRETKIQTYESSCLRQAILGVEGIIGAVSTLPSQGYTITGKPLPRYRQFLIETEYGIAHLNVAKNEELIDVSASFSGHEEMPEGIDNRGAELLASIINAVERDCANGI